MSDYPTLSISEVRKEISEVVSRAHYSGEPTVIARNGRPVAVVVSVEDFEAMQALEDRLDIEEATRRMDAVREGLDDVIPAADVHRELHRGAKDAATP